MQFKKWLIESSDNFPLNKLMYDLESEEGRRQYDDDLKDYKNLRDRTKIISKKSVQEDLVVTCWTGCSEEHFNRLTIVKKSDYRIINANQSRSGAIWFAHQYQANGMEYAKNHAQEILITYPLVCKSYYDILNYEDGKIRIRPSDEKMNNVHPFIESRWAILSNKVVQTPNNWLFSEQGHLICVGAIKITNDMVNYIHH